MKTTFLLIIGLITSQASAGVKFKADNLSATELKALLSKYQSRVSVAPPTLLNRVNGVRTTPPTPGVPIREAKLKAFVYKIEVSKLSDDSYSIKFYDVCKMEGVVPVYDLRLSGYGLASGPAQVCSTTVEGRPATVEMMGAMALEETRWFPDEPTHDVKWSSTVLTVRQGTDVPQLTFGIELTRDLAAKSLLGSVGADSITVCKSANDGSGDVICEVATGEFFSANYEVID